MRRGRRGADLSGVTREWLWQKYVVEDVGTKAISKLLGCAIKTTSRLLRENNIAVARPRIGRKWTGCGDMSGTYWTSLVLRAGRCGWAVEITKQEAWDLFQAQDGKCYFTGVQLNFNRSTRDPTEQTASLDRLDSSLGYVVGNVAWVHKRINKMKTDYSKEEFLHWCRAVALHSEKEKT